LAPEVFPCLFVGGLDGADLDGRCRRHNSC
jgi:hypothetical protein